MLEESKDTFAQVQNLPLTMRVTLNKSFNLSFLICKTGIITVTVLSTGCCMDQMIQSIQHIKYLALYMLSTEQMGVIIVNVNYYYYILPTNDKEFVLPLKSISSRKKKKNQKPKIRA